MLVALCVSCTKDPSLKRSPGTSAATNVPANPTTGTTSATGPTTVTATGTLTPGPILNIDYRDKWIGTYYSKFYLVYSTTSVINPNFLADTTVYDSVRVFHNTVGSVVKLYPFYSFDGINCSKDTASFTVDTSGVYYLNWGGGSVGSVLLDFRTADSVKYNSNSSQWWSGNSTYRKTVMSGKKQ